MLCYFNQSENLKVAKVMLLWYMSTEDRRLLIVSGSLLWGGLGRDASRSHNYDVEVTI